MRPCGPAEAASKAADPAASTTQVHCGTSDGEVRSLDAASLELASAPMRVTQGARATAVAVLGADTMTDCDTPAWRAIRRGCSTWGTSRELVLVETPQQK